MKLPNAERAVVEEAKITRYFLNLASKDGHGKAKFFLAHGFSLARWYELEETLLWHAVAHDVVDVVSGVDGTLYVVEGVVNTPDGRSPYIRSIWYMETGRQIPRLTSGVSPQPEEEPMIAQYEACILTEDLPQHRLNAGARGVVVDYTSNGETYIVEFFTPEGETIDVIFVEQDQVRPAPETMPTD